MKTSFSNDQTIFQNDIVRQLDEDSTKVPVVHFPPEPTSSSSPSRETTRKSTTSVTETSSEQPPTSAPPSPARKIDTTTTTTATSAPPTAGVENKSEVKKSRFTILPINKQLEAANIEDQQQRQDAANAAGVASDSPVQAKNPAGPEP